MSGWRGVALWLGLLPGMVKAETMRDPFQPQQNVSCEGRTLPDEWRLKGMVGSSSRWVGWLAQAQSGWLRVRDGDVIPPGDFRVTRLDRTGATLRPTDETARCGAAEFHLGSPFRHKKE
ncbi:Inner membrane protein [Dickeya dadantii 3937]|uniref:Inner membrane protein n=1 Tax=Dickeya dadantii (strain 3937) TaxID=198628 RepID=E0SJR9_DICD3|nr:HofP DNA utilization family protein [Dickeya dadantii]ADN00358.1 Inner membrane protein [Dickeya dadantii 3937]